MDFEFSVAATFKFSSGFEGALEDEFLEGSGGDEGVAEIEGQIFEGGFLAGEDDESFGG